MLRTTDISQLVVTVVRVTLVFALTFVLAFQFQQLAFGEGESDAGQPTESTQSGEAQESSPSTSASSTPDPSTSSSSTPDPAASDAIVDIVVYEKQGAASASDKLVRDLNDTVTGAAQSYVPEIKKRKGSMEFNAYVGVRRNGVPSEESASKYVNWMFQVGDREYALEATDKETGKVIATIDSKTGKVTATGEASGYVTVVCAIKEEYANQVDPTFVERYQNMPFATAFGVNIMGQKKPFVASVQVLRDDGTAIAADEEVLVAEATENYAFQAFVNVYDPSGDQMKTYTVTRENPLKNQVQADFPDTDANLDLVWSVVESDPASMNAQTGELAFNGAETATVRVEPVEKPEDETIAPGTAVIRRAVPRIQTIEILPSEQGPQIADGVLTVDEDTTGYTFRAHVTIGDGIGDPQAYTLTSENGLAAQTGGRFKDLVWSVGEGPATIEQNGTLTLNKAEQVVVTASEPEPKEGEDPVSASVTVTRPVSYIESVEIRKEDGSAFAEGEDLEVATDATGYTFQALVKIVDPQGQATEYQVTSEEGRGLAAQTAGRFSDLVWSVDPETASVPNGVLALNDVDSAVVTASAVEAAPGQEQPASSSVMVKRHIPEAAYVESVEILKEDGSSFGEDELLSLPADDNTVYKLGLRVVFRDPEADKTTEYVKNAEGWSANGTPIPVKQDGQQGASASEGASGSDAQGSEAGGDAGSTAGEGGSTSGSEGSEGASGSEGAVDGLPFTVAWDSTDPTIASVDAQGGVTVHAKEAVTIRVSAGPGKEGATVVDSVDLNQRPERDPGDGILHVYTSYDPVPRGEDAVFSSYIWGIRNITYITLWEESADGGETWTELDTMGEQTLRRPTTEPYIGRLYRSKVEIIEDPGNQLKPEERIAYSNEEELRIGEDKLRVELFVDHVPEGQNALFTTRVHIPSEKAKADAIGTVSYIWEESVDNGKSWDQLVRGNYPTYSVLTERGRMGSQFRVWVVGEDGSKDDSNVQMLAALDTGGDESSSESTSGTESGSGTESTSEGGSGSGSSTESTSGSESGSGGAAPTDPTSSTKEPDSDTTPEQDEGTDPAPDQESDPTPTQPDTDTDPASEQNPDADPASEPSSSSNPVTPDPNYQTLSQEVDAAGQLHIQFNGEGATIQALGNVGMANASNQQQPQNQSRPDVLIDSKVNEDIAQMRAEEAAERQAELDAQPGAHWNPIYFVDKQDPMDLMQNNPFAPFVLPLCLALVAAGALEKFLRYRKEKQPSAARF